MPSSLLASPQPPTSTARRPPHQGWILLGLFASPSLACCLCLGFSVPPSLRRWLACSMKKRYGSPHAGCGQLREKGKKTPEHFDDECDIFHARSGANGENPYRINSEARFVCSKTIACIGPNSSTCLRLELLTVHRVCSRIPSKEPDDGWNLILAIINMLAIGIETSGYIGSLALLRDGELIDERSLGEPGRRHAQALVLELRDMLQRHGAGSSAGGPTWLTVHRKGTCAMRNADSPQGSPRCR